MLNRLIALTLAGFGAATGWLLATFLIPSHLHGLTTGFLIGFALALIEIAILRSLKLAPKSALMLDGRLFPYFSLGIAAGIIIAR
jgi:hypothetical protein